MQDGLPVVLDLPTVCDADHHVLRLLQDVHKGPQRAQRTTKGTKDTTDTMEKPYAFLSLGSPVVGQRCNPATYAVESQSPSDPAPVRAVHEHAPRPPPAIVSGSSALR